MTDHELVGREPELAELDRFLQRSTQGSHALQIEGSPGMGKTALWHAALAAARRRSWLVVTARPVEIETKLAFAGLTDLLEPVLDDVLPALPGPQRRAFEVALLIAPSRAQPDQRTVAAAFLNALRTLAEDRHVLVAIDDLQWLDSSSQQVVGFAARRLGSEPVGFIATRRVVDGESQSAGLLHERLMRLSLGPLSLTAIGRLIEADLGQALPRPVLRRIHEVSEGNPFFALEQARAIRQSGLHLGSGQMPVPPTLRSLVQDRLAKVPDAERETLLAVAALAAPTRELLVSLVGAGESAWPPLIHAFESGIVEVADGQVRFTHPLLGSVLYADTPVPVRHDLHRRLAELVHDPEESARHLALSVDEPSEDVASRLEAAAAFAEARGAPSSAGELLELAAGLTPTESPLLLSRRLIAAAGSLGTAGDTARSLALCRRALEIGPPGSQRALALINLGRTTGLYGNAREAAVLFAKALQEQCDDAGILVSLESELAWNDHMLGDLESAERHAQNAVLLAEELPEDFELAGTLADLGLIQMLRRRSGYRLTLNRALGLAAREGMDEGTRAFWWRTEWQNAMAVAWAGDLEPARRTLEGLHRRATERGDELAMPHLVSWLSRIAFLMGDWPVAAQYAEEGCELAVSAPHERVYALMPRAAVWAHLGHLEAARRITEEGLSLVDQTGMKTARLEHDAIRGALELSVGDVDAAHRFLAPLPALMEAHGFLEPVVFRFDADLIEVLVARGETHEAAARLLELEGCADRFPRSWAAGASARCRALLADDAAEASAHYEAALAHHDLNRERFERARTLLLYGVALRRAKHRREARNALENAKLGFEELGAALWAERARGELARISGPAPRSGGLTETERRIADLATSARSNKQIAAQLHITVRTVESNLTRIYRKLGVASRAELAQQLSQRSVPTAVRGNTGATDPAEIGRQPHPANGPGALQSPGRPSSAEIGSGSP
jgi:DNA-binding CsgD family transcriptional regulator